MASYIGQVKIGTGDAVPVGSMLYGTCSTAAGTAQKEVTLAAFDTLATGVTVHVKFTNSNTVANPTLKVGSTAAKPIIQYGSTAAGTTDQTSWKAGAVVSFTYDATYNSNSGGWFINTGVDTNTTYTAANAAPGKVASSSTQGTSSNYARQDHTHGIDLATGDSNGQVKIAGTNVSVKGLAGAAYKGVDTSIASGSTSTNVPTSAAVASLISTATSGLTGAMHFKGTISSLPSATDSTTYSTYAAGDVVLVGDKEYVYDKGANATDSAWVLLGDEGSYALKTSTTNVGSASGWSAGANPSLSYTARTVKSVKTNTAGTAASLTTTTHTIPNVTAAGSATTASVASGTLTITNGSAPTLGTAFSVKAVNVFTANTPTAIATEDIACDDITAWSAGTAPSLTVTATTVVKP